ncbi:energy-coupling factor transporter transmembrane component T [Schinkia azotoformans]|uniref:ABC transporter permease n=1 Tax=Schinkia azotoformans LMG 9581 TaxID=1131731 RepID=K6BVU7_SCHAZ|nr:energy-coupling factor transporter transmembrane component T [Schinkia azotoformans]EKN63030.1 ABC transporter permease [Schinkia azotoformans LMG 9581]MEC1639095.1 energy-coupling factor transporter transmembrane component T [Schinkia azotoformans]MEC1722322.1 energy-coupling factor transporter transmembrane component T [Schinkia azotoformans]MEC1945124.1 energy-coupling factor transporter transmembrane component T [Schinkia azotoformans]MED4414582.1 energy-coupling factor transporter tran
MNNSFGFNSLHPAICFLYYIGLFLISMLFIHPYFLLAALVSVILLNFFHNRGKEIRKGAKFYIFIGVVILLINPLFSHRGATILFYLFDQPITLESMMFGFLMMLSIVTIIITFLSFNFIITEDKFIYLFSSFAPKTALLIMMAFRFVPLLKRRLIEIANVQKTRGISIKSGTIKQRAKAGMSILFILMTWSMEEALQTADSMKARGYGLGKRSSFNVYRFYKQDVFFLIWFSLLMVIFIIQGISGYGKLEIYPQLEALPLSNRENNLFVLVLLFLFTPHFIEGREYCKWRLSK